MLQLYPLLWIGIICSYCRQVSETSDASRLVYFFTKHSRIYLYTHWRIPLVLTGGLLEATGAPPSLGVRGGQGYKPPCVAEW
jgi:hypothetical protein